MQVLKVELSNVELEPFAPQRAVPGFKVSLVGGHCARVGCRLRCVLASSAVFDVVFFLFA